MFESERLIFFLDTKLKHILWVRYSKDSSPTTQIQNKGIKYIMTEHKMHAELIKTSDGIELNFN